MDSFAQFQGMAATVKTLRNRLKVMRADADVPTPIRQSICKSGFNA